MLHFMMANTTPTSAQTTLSGDATTNHIYIFVFCSNSRSLSRILHAGAHLHDCSKSIFFAYYVVFSMPIKNNLVNDDSICRDFMNASILLHTLMMNYGPLSRVAFYFCEALRLLSYYRLHRPPLIICNEDRLIFSASAFTVRIRSVDCIGDDVWAFI